MVKFVKSKLCILIMMVFIILLSGCNTGIKKVSSTDSVKDIRVQHWIEDIDYLHVNLPKVHKNLYHSIKKEDFDKETLKLKNDVAELKDYEIKCRLAQIVASVGDAHTSLNLSFNNSSIYPMVLRWFSEDLRVIATGKEHKDILGKKLTNINGTPINEIMKKIDSLISHENNQWLKVIDVQYVVMPDVLKFLGITLGDDAQFSFEDDSNTICKFKFYPGTITLENVARVIDEMPVKPLRIQYNFNSLADNLYWYKYIPEDKILYFQYNQCIDRDIAQRNGIKDYEKYPDFEKFSERLLKVIANNNIDKFVVDLRNNTGGDSSLMSKLVVKLTSDEKLKGKIYVIIGKETFSSGVFAAIDFMKSANAIFYGEPTGGNVNGYGDVRNLVLPNSRLQISYSTEYFSLSDKFRENFIPDVEVDQTFNDYKHGIDDVYEAIKNCRS